MTPSNLYNPKLGIHHYINNFSDFTNEELITFAKNIGFQTLKIHNEYPIQFLEVAKSNNISVSIHLSNEYIQDFAYNKFEEIGDLLHQFSSTIVQISLGNNPLDLDNHKKYMATLPLAVHNLYEYLSNQNLNTTFCVPLSFNTVNFQKTPSNSQFSSNLTSTISDICATLQASSNSFFIDLNLFEDYQRNSNPDSLPFYLFSATDHLFQYDDVFRYENQFDLYYDAVIVALEKIGFGELILGVSKCGWPSNTRDFINAQTFNQNLIEHCKNGKGTPRRPNTNIPCYMSQLMDTIDKSSINNNLGIYTSKGNCKYPLHFMRELQYSDN